MRRLIIEEPVSRAAHWSPRLAWFALAVTLIAVLYLRAQWVEQVPGFISLATGLMLAMAAVALAALAFVRIWTDGRRGLGRALKGLFLAGLVLAYPGWFALKGVVLPRLNDVTTDLDNPPAFSRSRAALAARHGRVPPEPPPESRLKQRQAYPQVAPLVLDVPPDDAFEFARKAAEARGWQIVDAVKPGGRFGIGHIDAVDRSLLLRLADDVTVRIRPSADGTRVDVRSASRVGSHDFGANAQRIRRYLEVLAESADSEKK